MIENEEWVYRFNLSFRKLTAIRISIFEAADTFNLEAKDNVSMILTESLSFIFNSCCSSLSVNDDPSELQEKKTKNKQTNNENEDESKYETIITMAENASSKYTKKYLYDY